MSYLTSNDSAYDTVLAKIFNYISENEESKFTILEKECRFDLNALAGAWGVKYFDYLVKLIPILFSPPNQKRTDAIEDTKIFKRTQFDEFAFVNQNQLQTKYTWVPFSSTHTLFNCSEKNSPYRNKYV